MAYTVQLKPSVVRKLAKLQKTIQIRIARKINSLAIDPRPPGMEKLKGGEGLFRVRVGKYRIIYQVKDDQLLVLVVEIGHRKEVYR